MTLILLLVALPPAFGLIVLLIKDFHLRRIVVVTAAVIEACLAIALTAASYDALPLRIVLEIPGLDAWILGGELVIAAIIAVAAVRKRRLLPLLLALGQVALAILGERWTGGVESVAHLVVDQASLIMILLVSVVGGLILFYAAGYMQTYHLEHPEVRDRRRLFSFMNLCFIGAMQGLILSNDLRLMLLFWEFTTLASFVLIGYASDAESDKSAFRALNLNLVGGIAFALGIVLLAAKTGSVELDFIAASGLAGKAATVAAPVAFLALAGLVKSAQLPFTPWLLGAMVAPTPVSALLHSSTMVKAGVYLLLRLAPAMEGTTGGYLVAFIGIFTFIAGAFAAVSRRNAKRILALSTVSNLGLIATCAGIGTYQLVWVAFFLIIFHAIAKALLFLAVGSASVGTGSLDVEDMGALIIGMPRVTIFLVIGISAMFIAPFGMLVSKWAAMEAFINMNSIVSPLMIVFLAFGSATTILFWAKWLGILIRMPDPYAPRGLLETKVSGFEFVGEWTLAALTVIACVVFPLVSTALIEPYLLATYGRIFGLDRNNAIVTVLMVIMTVAVPGFLILISRGSKEALSPAYMSGRVTGSDLSFKGSAGAQRSLETRSYYFENFFNEGRILNAGIGIGIFLVITILGTAIV